MPSDEQNFAGGIHITSVKDHTEDIDSEESQGLHIGFNQDAQADQDYKINHIEEPDIASFNIGAENNQGIRINHVQDSEPTGFHIGAQDADAKILNTGSSVDTEQHINLSKTKNQPRPLSVESLIPNVHVSNSQGFNSIESLFDYAREHFASDIHIATGSKPKLRLFGDIEEIQSAQELTPEVALQFIHETMSEELKKEFAEKYDVDYSYKDSKGRRYRCNALMHINGPSGVFRIISDKIISFEELGLPESLRRIENFKKGLVLVTGPAGCGKSTTLATLVDIVNRKEEGHILTIEDPVEILHESKKSLVNHRELKTHTKSFARALKSALREDPDCIMIGEMRDLETISLALTAAETGHLVFGTLHTSSAAKTITRIIDVFPFGEQGQIRAMLGEGIQCVISQVLCKRKDGNGRVAVFEVMFGTEAIRNLVRTDKVFQINSAIEVGMKEDMQTMDQALKKMVAQNIIDVKEAKLYAKSPEDF